MAIFDTFIGELVSIVTDVNMEAALDDRNDAVMSGPMVRVGEILDMDEEAILLDRGGGEVEAIARAHVVAIVTQLAVPELKLPPGVEMPEKPEPEDAH